jgi:2-oxo-4-hydroxy-4-carboxy-5-ureidoimidazoline decarboxylase
MPADLAALNAMPVESFTMFLGGIFEHSPWVARAAADGRPYATITSLHTAMVAVVETASSDQQLALLCAHPELAKRGPLTAASAAEQGGKGLARLDADEAAVFDALNTMYRSRFGFPFIIAVRGQRDRTAIRLAMGERVKNAPEQERKTALAEVAKIARFRLEDLIKDGV